MNTSVEQKIQDVAVQHANEPNQSFAKLCLVANTQWKTVEVNGEEVEIPQGWDVKKIGDITNVCSGGTPSTKDALFWNGNIPWLSSGEVCNKKISNTEKKISDYGLKNSSAKMVPIGSVMIALAGQGKTRGQVGITTIDLCTNQSIGSILPGHHFHSSFLFYNLLNRYDEIRSISGGDSGRGGLNLEMIKNISVNMPPISKQTLIAQILTTQEEHIANLKQQSSVQRKRLDWLTSELLTGRILVQEDINGEPTVLERDEQGNVLKSLPAVTLSANTQWKTVEVNGEDVEIPQGWLMDSAESYISLVQEQRKHQIPSSKVLKFGNVPVISQEMDFVNGYTNDKSKSIVAQNNPCLIFGDHTTILKYVDFDFVLGGDGTKVFRPTKGNCKFMYFALKNRVNPIGYSRHFKFLKELSVNMPPIAEQNLIAQALTAQEEYIASLDQMIVIEEKRLAWLTDELLSGRILVEEVTE